jgi:hypothetical protein
VASPEPVQVTLNTSITLTPGSGVPLQNMNFAKSDSTNVSVTLSPIGVTLDDRKASQIIYPSSTNITTVGNNLESPFILNTTDEYYFDIANIGGLQQIVTISMFFREV